VNVLKTFMSRYEVLSDRIICGSPTGPLIWNMKDRRPLASRKKVPQYLSKPFYLSTFSNCFYLYMLIIWNIVLSVHLSEQSITATLFYLLLQFFAADDDASISY